MKKNQGLTIVELLIALGIFAVVAVATTSLVFGAINLRDQALATTKTEEGLRVLNRTLKNAIQNAKTVTGSGGSLYTSNSSDCWSFVYDDTGKNLNFGEVTTAGCSPTLSPVTKFFPATVQLTSINFIILPLETGGRVVTVSGTVHTILPFNDYQTSFSESYTNVID